MSDPTRHRDAFSSRCATRDRERQVGTGYGFGLFVGDAFGGEININNVVRGAFQCGVVGYWIDERHAGNRYVAEGVVVLCRFAFDELHLHRLEICIVPRNTKSRRVMGLVFSEEQGSFLVGAAAALKSKTGQVGYIGGVSGLGGLLEKFEAGFTAGAKAANPNIKVIAKYISAAPDVTGFNSPDKARDIANAMYAGGADIIYAAAGGAGAGVFEAAKATSDSSGSKVWAIGVDSDQYNTADPAVKDFILTSMFGVMIWALIRKNTSDTILAACFGGGAVLWYLLADTPTDWWAEILPYVIVLVVLVFFTKRLRPPAADGQVYRKGEA